MEISDNENVKAYIVEFRKQDRRSQLRSFLGHFIAYIVVNTILVVANIIQQPEFHWFWFPVAFWGVGLLMHLVFGVILAPKFLRQQEQKVLNKLTSQKHD